MESCITINRYWKEIPIQPFCLSCNCSLQNWLYATAEHCSGQRFSRFFSQSSISWVEHLMLRNTWIVRARTAHANNWRFYFKPLFSSETDNFVRPLALLLAIVFWPSEVDMRSRKPCLLRRLRFDGWNVLFMTQTLYYSNSADICPHILQLLGKECKGRFFSEYCKVNREVFLLSRLIY